MTPDHRVRAVYDAAQVYADRNFLVTPAPRTLSAWTGAWTVSTWRSSTSGRAVSGVRRGGW
jgi:hypothetical protein